MRAKISVQTRRSADEYAAILYDLLRMRQIPREEIDGCILSSVVPELTGLVEEAARTVTGTVPVRVGPGIRTGFPIRIDDPSQLGGDLVADTLAALTEYGAPVDGGRAYLGGCIVPGIRQGAAVLKDTAALLPSIELGSCEESCLGRSSADAIRCGLLLSSAMTVDGFLDRYSALPGMAGAKCVATGGSAELVTALCRRPVLVDPELTLKGLRYLYEANRPKTRRS